jgi:hypothetical protein
MADGKLPEMLLGHWDTTHGAHLAREYARKTRDHLCNGKESDMGLAFDVAMLMRNDLNFEPILAAAKDRIRWLSVQLALSEISKAELLAALEAVTVNFTVASHPDQARLDAARAAITKATAEV